MTIGISKTRMKRWQLQSCAAEIFWNVFSAVFQKIVLVIAIIIAIPVRIGQAMFDLVFDEIPDLWYLLGKMRQRDKEYIREYGVPWMPKSVAIRIGLDDDDY